MAELKIPVNNQVHTKKASVGTTVTITARGKHGYEFDHWEDLRAGDAGYTSATRSYVVKPSGNDLVAKFRDKNLGGITPVASQRYTLNGNNIDVNAPRSAGDYTVSFKFDGDKEWAHKVAVNGLNTNEYEITTHDQYEVVVKVIGDAIRKLGNANVVFTDRFNNTTTANYKAHSPTMYTINATISGATGTITQSHTGSVERNTRVVFNAPEVNGKKFIGWFVDQSIVGKGRELSYIIKKNTDLVAQYGKYIKEYNIYYGGGDITQDGYIAFSPISAYNDGESSGLRVLSDTYRDRTITYGLKLSNFQEIESAMDPLNAYGIVKNITSFDKIGTSYNFPENGDTYVIAVQLHKTTIDTAVFNEFIGNDGVRSNTSKCHKHWIVAEGDKTIVYSTGLISLISIESPSSTGDFTGDIGTIIRSKSNDLELSSNGTDGWGNITFTDVTNKFIRKKAVQYVTIDPGPYKLQKRQYPVNESIVIPYGDEWQSGNRLHYDYVLRPNDEPTSIFTNDENDVSSNRLPNEKSFEYKNNGVWEPAGNRVDLGFSPRSAIQAYFNVAGEYRVKDSAEVYKREQPAGAPLLITTTGGILINREELRKIKQDANIIKWSPSTYANGRMTINSTEQQGEYDSVYIDETNLPITLTLENDSARGGEVKLIVRTNNVDGISPGYYKIYNGPSASGGKTYIVNANFPRRIPYVPPYELPIYLHRPIQDNNTLDGKQYEYRKGDTYNAAAGLINNGNADIQILPRGYNGYDLIIRGSGSTSPQFVEYGGIGDLIYVRIKYTNADRLIRDSVARWKSGNSPIISNERHKNFNQVDFVDSNRGPYGGGYIGGGYIGGGHIGGGYNIGDNPRGPRDPNEYNYNIIVDPHGPRTPGRRNY